LPGRPPTATSQEYAPEPLGSNDGTTTLLRLAFLSDATASMGQLRSMMLGAVPGELEAVLVRH